MKASIAGKPAAVDVLVYVEDPGAANYCLDLPGALERKGLRTRLLSEGYALPYLLSRGSRVEAIQQPASAREILDEACPRLLVVGTSDNPDSFGFELTSEACSRGLANVAVIDAFGNSDKRFRGRTDEPLHHAPDWLVVPDIWTKEAYVALGFPEGRIAVCGHPHYDRVLRQAELLEAKDRRQQRRSLFHNEHDERPVCIFGAEISVGRSGPRQRSPEYTLAGRGERHGRTEIVLEEFLDAVSLLERKPYLILRLHPKNTLEELAPYLSSFDQISKNEPSIEIVHAADFIVGMTSILLVEAAIMGRPTLSIVPRFVETKSLATIRCGLTISVTTREKLRAVLPVFLENRLRTSPDRISEFIRPGSLERTVGFFESLLAHRPAEKDA
ncbi:MAG TPA: hypothetical protein PLO63_02105 [Syntrophales bacterium]|jgi:hypothetical protein|nr:hypothetical protein [Syntrophales bacterium]